MGGAGELGPIMAPPEREKTWKNKKIGGNKIENSS
jgi:hypothetical protein